MKVFKEKLYWILMPPFLIAAILTYLFLPQEYNYLAFLVVLLFWIVYYGSKFYTNKKQRDADG